MWQGKKATSQRIFYGAMNQIKKRMPDLNPIDVFTQAVENVKPPIEVRSKRVGGATYQVPMQVKPHAPAKPVDPLDPRRLSRQGRPADVPALADELMPPTARRRSHDQAREHIKMADSNKAFAHFAGESRINHRDTEAQRRQKKI